MIEEEIIAIKKKIEEKTISSEEALTLLKELNFSVSKLNQELKDLKAINNLQNKN